MLRLLRYGWVDSNTGLIKMRWLFWSEIMKLFVLCA